MLCFLSYIYQCGRKTEKTQNVPNTKMLMRKHLEPRTPLYLITMNHPNKKKKSPLTPVPFQQMVDSISQLMCCGLALLNFTQSISQSYRWKCVIQQAQLYVLTWKMCISFPAKINHKEHVPHLCPKWAAQPCSVKCIYDPLTLCSLSSLDGSQGPTSTI